MSNLANYSPYNKSYKFILFQNQAYHQRNKRNASPCVRTNLRHSLSRFSSPNKNPQRIDLLNSNISSPRQSVSPQNKSCRSSLFEKRRQINGAIISEPKRVVHKNQSFEKFRSQKISHQNVSMVSRILNSECQVIKGTTAQKSFKNHIRYQNIRRRYNELGQRKDYIALGDSSMLCPTLMQFHDAGLGSQFVERDLSMSIKPSTAQTMRRSYHSNFPG